MRVLNTERLKPYLVELIRVLIIIIVIYVLNNFISSLPFVSDVTVLNEDIHLTELISFIMIIISCFIIYEFALKTQTIVNEILVMIPQSGLVHSYVVYLVIIIMGYFSGHNIFIKSLGDSWIWCYNLFFIGFSLFFVSKIIIIFYQNSRNISSNVLDIIAGEIFKK